MRFLAALSLACVCAVGPLDAGSSQNSKAAIDRYGATYVQQLTDEVNKQLDERRANVAIVARCGRSRDKLPKGVEWTHVAITVFEPVKREDGHVGYTYSVYNLYQGFNGSMDKSHLVQDFMYDMCAGAVEPEIAVAIPSEDLQKRILAVVRSPAYASFHIPEYNLIANPADDQYDNCVTHTLKVVVAAIYKTDDPAVVYDAIDQFFKPTEIRLSLVEQLGSGFVDGIHTDDQDGRDIETATYGSLKSFLDENGLLKDSFVVRVEPPKVEEPPAKRRTR